MDTSKIPRPQESLKDYVKRIRHDIGMTQFDLAIAAGIHSRSVGKIERGLTTKINRKTLHGLAIALSVPQEYLKAVSDPKEIQQVHSVKFCPRCWTPGSAADPMWHNPKAKYCYICSMQLRTNCASCGELVVSLKYRFCPMCGSSYKEGV